MKDQSYALVTGASNGIGKFLALECAKRKMNLVLLALPDTGLDAVAYSLEIRYGIKVITFEGDLTEMGFLYFVNNQLTERGIKLMMLINNAGMGYEGRFEELSVDFCNNLMLLNIQALVILCRLFSDNLKQSESAYLLNVSSLASFTPMPYKSMYSASKSFVYFFSRALAEELKETPISVSILCPGSVPTNARVKQSIQSHGWLAKYSSLEPGEMASIAIRDTLRRKKVIVPGFCNKISLLLMKAIPSALQLIILARAYRKRIVNA